MSHRPQLTSGVRRVDGIWLWLTKDVAGLIESTAVGRPFWDRRRPLGNHWRAAWTRQKHLRRAAEMYGSQAEQRCRHLADMPLDDPGQDIAAAHDYEFAYREAAERADWGTRP